jgi:hypothetical protein
LKRRAGLRQSLLTGAAILALLLVLGPMAPVHPMSSGVRTSAQGSSAIPAASDFSATVDFQGIPVADHTSSGSAITTSFADQFSTVFHWSSPDQATLVTKGELTVLFLGASIGTSAQTISGAVPNTTGSITLSNTDFSQDRYLFEGVYECQASLFDQGTAIWNTTFWVWIQAPDHLTVVNVALILIGLYEVWQIVALGSARVARKELGLDKPPKQGGT